MTSKKERMTTYLKGIIKNDLGDRCKISNHTPEVGPVIWCDFNESHTDSDWNAKDREMEKVAEKNDLSYNLSDDGTWGTFRIPKKRRKGM